jgi:hypothetical protein
MECTASVAPRVGSGSTSAGDGAREQGRPKPVRQQAKVDMSAHAQRGAEQIDAPGADPIRTVRGSGYALDDQFGKAG